MILDIFFPKKCIGCGREGKYICNKCEVFLSENSFACPICKHSSFFGETHNDCFKRNGLNGLISIWDYEGIIKNLIHDVKYGGSFDLINEALNRAFEIMANNEAKRFNKFLEFLAERPVICYVPMFIKKEREKGFNQAKIIAEKLAKKGNKKVVGMLKKIEDTEDQAKLDREHRLINIKQSFICVRSGLTQAVLVDDVFTTGATMGECCRVLKQAGVEKVWGFTIARTV